MSARATPTGQLLGDLLLYGGSAGFALLTAATSTLDPHRAWGALAAPGYLAATGCVLAQLALAGRRGTGPAARAALAAATWVLTALLPLMVEAAQRAAGRADRAQEEVLVVEAAGSRLLHHGTPYLGRAAIAALPEADRLLGYTPYQPGMALFGLPRALAGGWVTDARVWFAVVTAVVLAAAATTLTRDPPQPATGPAPQPGNGAGFAHALVRAGQLATVLPLSALTLATGGDDLPVLALCLLALALTARRRAGAAGAAIGAAGALKLFALPVAVVLLATAAAAGGRPRAIRFALPAFGLPLLALLPAALVDPGAAVENVLRFPLGRGLVTSPAQSPLPGRLLSLAVPGGRLIALGLLGALAIAIALRLLRRPPAGAAGAAAVSAVGLAGAIALLPSTRFGYLLYPVALAAAIPALSRWRSG